MTREELVRILDFMDATKGLSQDRTRLSNVDPRWNIISYAMRRHLEGKLLTATSLASAAETSYGTAMRRIAELMEEGFLIKRVRSKSGKSFSVHPSRRLIAEFESFAIQFKAMVGTTFGFTNSEGGMNDFYFGGYYMASRILPYPNAMRSGVGYDRTIRILSPIDPTFRTLSEFSSNLDEMCGTNIEIENLPLDELHNAIMANAARRESRYDLMAFDLPWIGELAEQGIIQPLDSFIAEANYSASDFHSAAWRGSAWRGKQFGLPIQPTVELLFCREDLFAAKGLAIPKTTEDVLLAARTLHRSALNLSGIVMNFGRGTPMAHSFIQSLADFGQPVINLRALGDDYDVAEIKGENFRPMLETEAARQTLEYLKELLQFAHPDSMKCNWDRRIRIFAEGHAAMTYGWSIRASAFEKDKGSPAHGKVAFVPHPPVPGRRPVSPIGGFSLGIPRGLTEQRAQAAWKVMEYLTRPELMKWYVQNGNLTSPRYSTSADPEVQAASRLISEIDGMERRGEVQIWPRPPIPEFSEMLAIMGDEIHAALQGDVTIRDGLQHAQSRIDALMRSNGRY